MVYDNQLLYKWQSNRFININDNISEEAMDVVGEYKLYNEQQVLVNHKLSNMIDLTEGRKISIGEYVPLTNGRQILLDREEGG